MPKSKPKLFLIVGVLIGLVVIFSGLLFSNRLTNVEPPKLSLELTPVYQQLSSAFGPVYTLDYRVINFGETDAKNCNLTVKITYYISSIDESLNEYVVRIIDVGLVEKNSFKMGTVPNVKLAPNTGMVDAFGKVVCDNTEATNTSLVGRPL